jgi:hypothetical protein
MENGFESPSYTSKVVENLPTPISAPATSNYLWNSNDPRDAGLWQNVEYVNNLNNVNYLYRIDTITDYLIQLDIILQLISQSMKLEIQLLMLLLILVYKLLLLQQLL